MEKISRYITYAEATKSQTASRKGLRNVPDPEQLRNMQFVGEVIFDPIRQWVGGMLAVSSFFRAVAVNRAIGGSETSQHCQGKAIDIDADVYNSNGVTNREVFYFIKAELEFDQLIWEFGTKENPDWVHVSHAVDGTNRRQVLRAYVENGKTRYVPFDL